LTANNTLLAFLSLFILGLGLERPTLQRPAKIIGSNIATIIQRTQLEQQDSIELIAVFKKTVEPEKARELLDKAGVVYREGMDSSRGKIYFYSTGPKFIITFQTEEEKERFMSQNARRREFHEIYAPNWDARKD
jgi:hypothetical protein